MRLAKSQIFLIFCLNIIGGIFSGWLLRGIEKEGKIIGLVILLIIGIMVISVFWSGRRVKIIGLAILFFVCGILRWEVAQPKPTPASIAYYNDQGEISFKGIVVEEPERGEKNTKLTLKISGPLKGKVLLGVPHYPQYHYGDELEVTGQVQTAQEYPDFSYKNYLSRFHIYSVCYPKAEKIKLLSSPGGNLFYQYILKLKAKVQTTIKEILPEPQASLLAGLILGYKGNFSPQVYETFSKTGLSHIVAVSGFNITLVSSFVMFTLLVLGFWRRQAFYFSVLFLILYVLLTGAPASAVRAGIMGFLLLLAQYLGRLSYSVNSIVLAGTAMLLANPKLLPYDVGFQLSFAVSMGIIYFYPILEDSLNFIANKDSKKGNFSWKMKFSRAFSTIFNHSDFLKKTIFLTLSAQVTALPLMMYHFGQLSLVAPLANLLVVPLIPFIMILGFISLALGFIYWFLGWLAGWLVFLPLNYIIKLSQYLSQIPYAFLEIKIEWWMVIIYYLLLGGLLIWYNKKRDRNLLISQLI